jgi:hypothetical protein
MLFKKILHDKVGIIILSAVWGFGISCLFKKICKDRSCIALKAPNPDTLTDNVYKHSNHKCYKYNTKSAKCTNDVVS